MQIMKSWVHTHPQTPSLLFVLKIRVEILEKKKNKNTKPTNSQQGVGGGGVGGCRAEGGDGEEAR